ncbi:MAG: hypothetical protein WA113_01430 [Desulfitobacteriaceae bacterium]
MIQGIVLKGYSGFYYVFAQDRVWECSLRGRFRVKPVLIVSKVDLEDTVDKKEGNLFTYYEKNRL